MTGTAQWQRCHSTPSAVCTRARARRAGLLMPASAERVTDHPPVLAPLIDVSLASVGRQLMGFHYQHLGAATVSGPPPPERDTQSSKVKLLGLDS